MDFNPYMWFSAIDAEEVVVGSKVLAGDSVDEIKLKAETPDVSFTNVLTILGEEESSRFACQDGKSYDLVYVLEMAQEEGAWTDGNFPEELVGDFVKYKNGTVSKIQVTGWRVGFSTSVCVANTWMSYQDLYDNYVRMDGSPCGYVAPTSESESTIEVPSTESTDYANALDIQSTDGDEYD